MKAEEKIKEKRKMLIQMQDQNSVKFLREGDSIKEKKIIIKKKKRETFSQFSVTPTSQREDSVIELWVFMNF